MPKQPKAEANSLLEQEKRAAEARIKRIFVKEKFYPALMKASTSIDDAKFLLGSFANMIMEQFLAQMKGKKFVELKLHEKLDKNSPNYKEYQELLALFGDEDVFTARELVEGMKNEIQMFVDDELKARPLSSLKTNFLEI